MPNKKELIKYLRHFNYRTRKTEGLFVCVNCPLYSGNFNPVCFEHDQKNASYFYDLKCSKRLELIYNFLGEKKYFNDLKCYCLREHINELIKKARNIYNVRLENE